MFVIKTFIVEKARKLDKRGRFRCPADLLRCSETGELAVFNCCWIPFPLPKQFRNSLHKHSSHLFSESWKQSVLGKEFEDIRYHWQGDTVREGWVNNLKECAVSAETQMYINDHPPRTIAIWRENVWKEEYNLEEEEANNLLIDICLSGVDRMFQQTVNQKITSCPISMQIEKQICANFLGEHSLEMPYLCLRSSEVQSSVFGHERERARQRTFATMWYRKASRVQLIFRDISSCHERKCPHSPTHRSPANFAQLSHFRDAPRPSRSANPVPKPTQWWRKTCGKYCSLTLESCPFILKLPHIKVREDVFEDE